MYNGDGLCLCGGEGWIVRWFTIGMEGITTGWMVQSDGDTIG